LTHSDSDKLLTGKVALVTGGSNDLGKTICHSLSEYGAIVIIHYFKNKERTDKICKEINSYGGSAVSWGADISDESAVNSLFNFIKDKFSRLDILVNNAHLPITRSFFNEVTWEEHQEQIDVMVKGAFYCSKEAVRLMGGQGSGSIINILTSQIDNPVKGYSSYVTASSALVGFTRNLAVEAGDKGIRVNMIAPGFVLTGHTPHAPLHVQEAIKKATPLGRLATPDDIAKAVIFFASDLSAFITGSYLVVDGGYSLSGRLQ
jgi:3-oxoacyl-[acyl-carrier protein] reductase